MPEHTTQARTRVSTTTLKTQYQNTHHITPTNHQPHYLPLAHSRDPLPRLQHTITFPFLPSSVTHNTNPKHKIIIAIHTSNHNKAPRAYRHTQSNTQNYAQTHTKACSHTHNYTHTTHTQSHNHTITQSHTQRKAAPCRLSPLSAHSLLCACVSASRDGPASSTPQKPIALASIRDTLTNNEAQ